MSKLIKRTYGGEVSFDSRLISFIQANPFIYDKQNEDYRNNQLKDTKWKEIAAELNTGVERCKKRWASLRDRFKRIKKDELDQLDSTGKKPRWRPRWRYYDVLHFIPLHFDTVVDNDQTDETSEDKKTMPQIAEIKTMTSSPASNGNAYTEPDFNEYFSNIVEVTNEPISPRSSSEDATDQFFKYIAQRVKRANLTSMEEMKVEAAILNFTIEKIAQIQSSM